MVAIKVRKMGHKTAKFGVWAHALEGAVQARQARRRRGGAVRVRPYLDSLPLFGQFQITYLSLKERPRLLLSVPSMHDRSNRYYHLCLCALLEPQYFLDVKHCLWVTQKAADL